MAPHEGYPNRETVLAVIPKNQLAIVAKTEGDKADKLEKVAGRVFVGGLSGAWVALIGGVVAAHSAPVIAPVLAITMVASFFGCGGTATVLDTKGQKARKRQTEAVGKRVERVVVVAKSALEEAVRNGTIGAELDLPIACEGETPKKVRVESIGAAVNALGEKKIKVNAWIIDGDGTSIDWLWGSSAVSLEQSVTAFPKVIHEASGQDRRIVAADALATLPVPVPHRTPDKILPRITP